MQTDVNLGRLEPLDTTRPPGWAIVELMGHIQMAGLVTIMPDGLRLIEVPAVPEGRALYNEHAIPAHTCEVGPGAIFRLTYCDESLARRAAAQFRHDPVPWAIRQEMRREAAELNQPAREAQSPIPPLLATDEPPF